MVTCNQQVFYLSMQRIFDIYLSIYWSMVTCRILFVVSAIHDNLVCLSSSVGCARTRNFKGAMTHHMVYLLKCKILIVPSGHV